MPPHRCRVPEGMEELTPQDEVRHSVSISGYSHYLTPCLIFYYILNSDATLHARTEFDGHT